MARYVSPATQAKAPGLRGGGAVFDIAIEAVVPRHLTSADLEHREHIHRLDDNIACHAGSSALALYCKSIMI